MSREMPTFDHTPEAVNLEGAPEFQVEVKKRYPRILSPRMGALFLVALFAMPHGSGAKGIDWGKMGGDILKDTTKREVKHQQDKRELKVKRDMKVAEAREAYKRLMSYDAATLESELEKMLTSDLGADSAKGLKVQTIEHMRNNRNAVLQAEKLKTDLVDMGKRRATRDGRTDKDVLERELADEIGKAKQAGEAAIESMGSLNENDQAECRKFLGAQSRALDALRSARSGLSSRDVDSRAHGARKDYERAMKDAVTLDGQIEERGNERKTKRVTDVLGRILR